MIGYRPQELFDASWGKVWKVQKPVGVSGHRIYHLYNALKSLYIKPHPIRFKRKVETSTISMDNESLRGKGLGLDSSWLVLVLSLPTLALSLFLENFLFFKMAFSGTKFLFFKVGVNWAGHPLRLSDNRARYLVLGFQTSRTWPSIFHFSFVKIATWRRISIF